MTITERIIALHKLLKKHKIDAYIIPSTDAHQSEYVPELWQRRVWISGFTGSAGDVAVTAKKAGLWTDSRYFLQAEKQLAGSGIDLYKAGLPETVSLIDFLKNELEAGQTLGIDPRLHGHNDVVKLQSELATRKIKVKYIDENLVDEIWKDQPEMPREPIIIHNVKYAGESVESKLKRIRGKMKAEQSAVHVITMLDALAWTFNIRGRDMKFNPVVIGYAIITEDKTELFIAPRKKDRDLKKHLKGLAKIYDYKDFRKRLLRNCAKKSKVWLDGGTISQWVVSLLEKRCQLFYKDSPVTMFKALKNEAEIAGAKACHVRDGAAMLKFLHWLEKAVPQGGVTEISALKKAEEFRAGQDLFMGASFETISSYQANGAIIHRSPTPEDNAALKPEGIFLFDSGGQYADGTTDITRTIALAEPTAEQKDRFTRVLKGHIAVATCSFPRGTQGFQLDSFARKALWDIGQNYGHGTGHGIGSFLGVHEGPQAISYYRGFGYALELGMILSNEPGFYKAGEYGLRIENIICIIKDEKKSSKDFEFYTFETISFCPIDLKFVEKSLLSREEINWLNDYHKKVFETLSPLLKADERDWLKKATQEI